MQSIDTPSLNEVEWGGREGLIDAHGQVEDESLAKGLVGYIWAESGGELRCHEILDPSADLERFSGSRIIICKPGCSPIMLDVVRSRADIQEALLQLQESAQIELFASGGSVVGAELQMAELDRSPKVELAVGDLEEAIIRGLKRAEAYGLPQWWTLDPSHFDHESRVWATRVAEFGPQGRSVRWRHLAPGAYRIDYSGGESASLDVQPSPLQDTVSYDSTGALLLSGPEVAVGGRLSGAISVSEKDFRRVATAPHAGYAVTGQLSIASAEGVSLYLKVAERVGAIERVEHYAVALVQRDGSFRFEDVKRGSYVFATLTRGGGGGDFYCMRRRFDVVDHDVDLGLVVPGPSAVAVRAPSLANLPGSIGSLEGVLAVRITPVVGGGVVTARARLGDTLRVTGLEPGRYSASLSFMDGGVASDERLGYRVVPASRSFEVGYGEEHTIETSIVGPATGIPVAVWTGDAVAVRASWRLNGRRRSMPLRRQGDVWEGVIEGDVVPDSLFVSVRLASGERLGAFAESFADGLGFSIEAREMRPMRPVVIKPAEAIGPFTRYRLGRSGQAPPDLYVGTVEYTSLSAQVYVWDGPCDVYLETGEVLSVE